MPKLKMEPGDLANIKELEEAEYEAGARYQGEVPPTGTMLNFRVTKIWWTYTENDDPMLKVLSVAEDNPGDLEEYDGLPCWDNMALTTGAKFKWDPFLDHFGLTIRDVKAKTMVDSDDDNIGAPITAISKWKPGSDAATFVGVVSKERYNGKWQGHIAEWLDSDTELDEEEEEEEKKPARRKPAAKSTTRQRHRRTEPEPEEEDEPEDEPEDEEEEEEEAPASRSRRRPASRAAKKATPARRGTRRRAAKNEDEDDEPPF
jgi:hypothetical protein